MNVGVICFIVLAILLTIILLTIYGISMCKENNALGLIPLFIGLNILGLIIGICIIYNVKNKVK